MSNERKPSVPAGKSEDDGAGKDSLASVLTFGERSDLVKLAESITSTIVECASNPFPLPRGMSGKEGETDGSHAGQSAADLELESHRRTTLRWYGKWKGLVLKRICDAASTRWEPLSQKRSAAGKSWDELSWDENPEEKQKPRPTPLDQTLQKLYPPIPTPLVELEHDKRLLLLHSMLLLLLSLKHYYAPSRVLLLWLASSLNLTTSDVDTDEERTAASLVSGAKEMSAKEEVEQKAKEGQTARGWKVFGASVAGAALIGITGGLAAPLVAAGIGTVMGGLGLGATAAAGLLGSLAGSSVLVGGLFGAYGGRMTGKMMDTYAQEISDFAFIPLRRNNRVTDAKSNDKGDSERVRDGESVQDVEPAERRLRVTIGVSGWLTERGDVVYPWRVVGSGTEVFALRWELEALTQLGSGMKAMITSAAWGYARTEILKLTVFSTLVGAVALPLGLLQLGKFVDNPFQVAKVRADKAGEVLADAIINRAQGERPVTLLGYSLGARLVHSCLQHLARRQAFGLVDSVVLFGASVPNSQTAWTRTRSVVGGRLINVFSENDYVLGFLYRTMSAQAGIAGLQRVEVPGVENRDVSSVVTSHFQYRHLIGQTLDELGMLDLDEGEVRREKEALSRLLEEERRIKELADGEKADGAEQKQLRDLMQTQAPVDQTPDAAMEEKAPELPPRRPAPAPAALPKENHAVQQPMSTSRPEALGRESPTLAGKHAEPDAQNPTPMQSVDCAEPEPDSDAEEAGKKISGIQLVDNDE